MFRDQLAPNSYSHASSHASTGHASKEASARIHVEKGGSWSTAELLVKENIRMGKIA